MGRSLSEPRGNGVTGFPPEGPRAPWPPCLNNPVNDIRNSGSSPDWVVFSGLVRLRPQAVVFAGVDSGGGTYLWGVMNVR